MFDGAPTAQVDRPMLIGNPTPAALSTPGLMIASILTSKIGIASIALHHARWVGICLLVGAALLVAGCWTGLADAQARTLVLGLLSGGIAMFAAALLLLRRGAVHDAVGSSAPTSSDRKLLTAPVATPLDTGIAEPQPLRQAVASIEPPAVPGMASTQAIPAAAIVNETRPVDGGLDVTALMDASLSDLLLAALCKDPVGARRIFAKALEHGSPPVSPQVPWTSEPAVPSAISPDGAARAVAIGQTTPAAP